MFHRSLLPLAGILLLGLGCHRSEDKAKATHLQNQLLRKDSEIKDLREKQVLARKKIQDLGRQVATKDRRIGDLQREVADRDGRITALEKRIKESKSETALADRRRRFQSDLRPIQKLIRELRPFFYVQAVDLGPKRNRVAVQLKWLERSMKNPVHAKFVDGWKTLGSGWNLLGDDARAQAALDRARQLTTKDETVNFLLALTHIHRSWTDLLLENRKGAQAHGSNALALLQALNLPALRQAEVWKQVARAHMALLQKELPKVKELCDSGLKQYKTNIGREVFYVQLALVQEGEKSMNSLSRAIQIKPHYFWALVLRGFGHAQLKKKAQAIADLKNALKCGAGPEAEEAVRKKLSALEK